MSCCQGHNRLREALIEKLLNDCEFPTMVGQQDGEVNIGPITPTVRNRRPYLGVSILRTQPLVRMVPTGWQKSRVMFYGISSDQIKATQLIDRMMCLVGSASDENCCPNRYYYDFSNDCINNKSTMFLFRRGIVFNNDLDTWTDSIEVEIIWNDCPCDNECKPFEIEVCEPFNPDCTDDPCDKGSC